jgi:two-component system, OmpR family, response regulator
MFERAQDEGFVMNGSRQRSILVIEDERRIADLIVRGLTGAGYGVDATPDGVSGLQRARSNHYAGVVLDLLLPDADGFELLALLVGESPGRPVVVVSGLAESDVRVRCLGLGATDYVAKPFSVGELVGRIRVGVDTSIGPGGRIMRVGPIRLDLVRRVVDTGRGAVSLSGYEFAVLQRMMARPGHVYSRSRLLEEVWGPSSDGRSDLIDVCVEGLQAKLGSELIETVWSAGYRIDLSAMEEGP